MGSNANAAEITVSFLGGLGTIGRNCALIESPTSVLVLDCGQMFPADHERGTVQAILPDLSEIVSRTDKLVGIVVTHSHEDHLGAIPYLLRDVATKVIGSSFTLAVLDRKLREAGVNKNAELVSVADGDTVQLGDFEVEFLHVTHSTPGGLMSVVRTSQGSIVHSSDFKLDNNPVDGKRTNLSRLGAISRAEGVRLLLADSTNAESEGWSASETTVGPAIRTVLEGEANRRVIIGAYARHIHRIQQIADCALEFGRTVVPLGRSMEQISRLAQDLGELSIPTQSVANPSEIKDLDPAKTLIVCTGTQGEPFAALARMASGTSRWLSIDSNDTVVFSSAAIPGNEIGVAKLRNDLLRRGARVFTNVDFALHTSGHGNREELRTLHAVAEPELFVPVHGEYFHLVAHEELARSMGMSSGEVDLYEDGESVVLSANGMSKGPAISGKWILVDNRGERVEDEYGDLDLLGRHGFVSYSALIDLEERLLVAPVSMQSRGWVSSGRMDSLHKDACEVVTSALEELLEGGEKIDLSSLSQATRRALGRFINASTGRRPVVVPNLSVL